MWTECPCWLLRAELEISRSTCRPIKRLVKRHKGFKESLWSRNWLAIKDRTVKGGDGGQGKVTAAVFTLLIVAGSESSHSPSNYTAGECWEELWNCSAGHSRVYREYKGLLKNIARKCIEIWGGFKQFNIEIANRTTNESFIANQSHLQFTTFGQPTWFKYNNHYNITLPVLGSSREYGPPTYWITIRVQLIKAISKIAQSVLQTTLRTLKLSKTKSACKFLKKQFEVTKLFIVYGVLTNHQTEPSVVSSVLKETGNAALT